MSFCEGERREGRGAPIPGIRVVWIPQSFQKIAKTPGRATIFPWHFISHNNSLTASCILSALSLDIGDRALVRLERGTSDIRRTQ